MKELGDGVQEQEGEVADEHALTVEDEVAGVLGLGELACRFGDEEVGQVDGGDQDPHVGLQKLQVGTVQVERI